MVYLPGYGDHLAEGDPRIRERMAELGAPERFEDVVAWIVPLADGLPPHWDVTFSVADADAAAARAVERGGRIVLPPTDMPWGADDRDLRPRGRGVHGQPVRAARRGGLTGAWLRWGRVPSAVTGPRT